jgi:hypothetical protein
MRHINFTTSGLTRRFNSTWDELGCRSVELCLVTFEKIHTFIFTNDGASLVGSKFFTGWRLTNTQFTIIKTHQASARIWGLMWDSSWIGGLP